MPTHRWLPTVDTTFCARQLTLQALSDTVLFGSRMLCFLDEDANGFAPKAAAIALQLMWTAGHRCLTRLLPWQAAADDSAAAAAGQPEEPCDFGEHTCRRSGRVCVGWKAAETWPRSAGRCLAANVSYVPSYSTDFRCVQHGAGKTVSQPQT